jgi:hypothetical protein
MTLLYFDKLGKPIGRDTWSHLLEDMAYRRVAWDELPGGGYVSTVWLGLDHGFGAGPPLIFESMTFPDPSEQVSHGRVSRRGRGLQAGAPASAAARPRASGIGRYTTLEEALEGHRRMVALLSAAK